MTKPQPTDLITEIDLAISGMTCAACVTRVEKKLNKLDNVNAVVNLATQTAHLTIQANENINPNEFITQIEKAGYSAELLTHTQIANNKTTIISTSARTDTIPTTKLKRRLVASAGLSLPVMVLSFVPTLQFSRWQWVVGILATIISLWGGYPFHKASWQALKHRSTNMNTLVSLGVLVAWGWSIWALLFGEAGQIGYTMQMSGIHKLDNSTTHLYFESATMIIVFLLLGRHIETKSRHHAGNALHKLLNLGAKQVFLIKKVDGQQIEANVAINELQVGDIFLVKAGEKIATDGVIVSGSSAIDASLLTGESLPIEVTEGDVVTGATLNTYGVLKIRATKVGAKTTLAQIGRLLTQAQLEKAPAQKQADKIAGIFVPTVMILAGLDFIVRAFVLHNTIEVALISAITVLVVACPCALGLATPTALLVGSSTAAQHGVLIRNAEILERAHKIDTIIFDKTGTLTTGTIAVKQFIKLSNVFSESQILNIAGNLEKFSAHPIGKAIYTYSLKFNKDKLPINNFQVIAGCGTQATVLYDGQNHKIHIGNLKWLAGLGIEINKYNSQIAKLENPTNSITALSIDKQLVGLFALQDTLKPESQKTISQLKEMGIQVIMASGDTSEVATHIGKKLDINAYGQLLPAEKMQLVREYQSRGQKVAMIGDGINDTIALTRADLAIGMGSGTDIAKASADITIVNSNISTIVTALKISRQTRKIIQQNLAWAFSYNLVAITLALGGVLIPSIAAAAMASSSIIVVTNSLRLRLLAPKSKPLSVDTAS